MPHVAYLQHRLQLLKKNTSGPFCDKKLSVLFSVGISQSKEFRFSPLGAALCSQESFENGVLHAVREFSKPGMFTFPQRT